MNIEWYRANIFIFLHWCEEKKLIQLINSNRQIKAIGREGNGIDASYHKVWMAHEGNGTSG